MPAATLLAPRAAFLADVAINRPLCDEHFLLTLRLPSFPPTEPGQFIQLACRDVNDTAVEPREIDWRPGQRIASHDADLSAAVALLRRPFSLAGRRNLAGGEVELDIIHRVVGVGTAWLSRLRPRDRVSLIGPLGNRFALPRSDQTALLVGGGVGIPPMLYLAEKLAGRCAAVAFAGATRRGLLPLTVTGEPKAAGEPTPCIAEFARYGIPAVVSTDDGSAGFRGFVTQALECYLEDAGDVMMIYTCGPEAMMKRVAQIAAVRGIDCEVAVERAMACGMGTCQSCCIRVLKPDPGRPPLPGSEWCYRLTCTDGPIFRGADLLW
jgi:dihydroorotate dehydrogenase electron transfer subunit